MMDTLKLTPPSNVLPLSPTPTTPNAELVEALTTLLGMAETGVLQMFWGVGQTSNRMAVKLTAGTAVDPGKAIRDITDIGYAYRQHVKDN